MSDSQQSSPEARLATRLLGPDGPELSCEECFAELDRYVEASLLDADPDRQVPGMRAHLQGCPACAEDFESLLLFCHELETGPS